MSDGLSSKIALSFYKRAKQTNIYILKLLLNLDLVVAES